MHRLFSPLLAALLACLSPGALFAQSAGERLCQRAAAPRDARPAPAGPYDIDDRFGSRTAETGAPALLCRSSQGVIGPGAVLPAITAFRVRGAEKAKYQVGERLDVHTRFGSTRLRVKTLSSLGFEVAAGAAPSPIPVACYAVKARQRQRIVTTAIVGQREEVLRVGAARRLCVDVDAQGTEHLCLQARRVEREKGGETVDVTTALGQQPLEVGEPVELCVPVIADTPPPPPPAPFTLRINPASLDMQPGETGRLTVAAFFAEGGSEDWSDKVTWVSSDETIAVVHTSSGGAFVTAGMRGTTTISAVDPKSSISSADSGGNAVITVVWPLEKLTISPPVARKKVGESEEYTVTGHFTGGTTMNLTQRVTYWSSYPLLASAPNAPGRRSRVHALAPGVTTIRATDPISGITTTDSANDATLRVGGGMPYIYVNPFIPRLVLRLGQSEQLTAVAYYPDESTKNVTQQCVWSSEDQWAPDGGPVLLTPNTEGDRSRIEAVAPGTAWVACLDQESERSGYLVIDVVSDKLVFLQLLHGQWPPLRDGVSRSVTAIGTFAPFEPSLEPWDTRGTLNLTQDVTYVSRDPDIAVATNEPGNRSRIVGVAPGVARIYAFDPTTGIESPDHDMLNLGRLVGIFLSWPAWNWTSRSLVMPEGSSRTFEVRGRYEAGGVVRLTRHEPDSFVLESDDSDVVGVTPGAVANITGVAAGRTTVTARHLATGIVSEPFEVTVKGELSGIELEPQHVTRALGDEYQFSAFALFPPDFRESMSQRFEYHSSDPSVAVATNDPIRHSLVRMVGSGTAVISAVDLATGITSTASGGDAVVEVLPGAIDRVTVEPIDLVLPVNGFHDYTAIGHYADGRTINLTKQVHWAVTDASVATAPSMAGGNSRIVAVGPGTTRVVATHLSGVSSSESNDDARLTVRPLATVTLTPAIRTAKAGTTIRYTVSGTLDDGTPVNLTQRAWYWIDPWEAARVPNDEDDRSRFDLSLPGTATVHAEVDGRSLSAELTIEP